MALDHNDILELVLGQLGRPGDTTLNTVLSQWINQSQRDMQILHRFRVNRQPNAAYIRMVLNQQEYGTSDGFPSSFLGVLDDEAVTRFTPDRVYHGTVTGGPFQEETITGGTSSATGTVTAVDSNNTYLDYTPVSGVFSEGETLTGSVSGATAAVSELVDTDDKYEVLRPISEDTARKHWTGSDDGDPEHYLLMMASASSTSIDTIKVFPRPDDNTVCVRLLYYAYAADLSGTTENWFTVNAPMALMWGALRFAAPYTQTTPERDPEQMFMMEVQRAVRSDNAQFVLDELGGELPYSPDAYGEREW